MKFGIALTMLQDGLCEGIRLSVWEKTSFIKIQAPVAYDKMAYPFLVLENKNGCIPWMVTRAELFANTWELVNPDTIKIEEFLRKLSSKAIHTLVTDIVKEDK